MLQPSITSQHHKGLSACHLSQGSSNDCGPFSTAMILNYLRGMQLQGDELAREMDKLRWGTLLPKIRRIPGSATFPWGIVDVLREHGLQARWSLFSNPEFLRHKLSSGSIVMPVFGERRPLWAHVAILVAYHPETGWGFVDPASDSSHLNWKTDVVFIRQWNALFRIVIEVNP